MAILSKEKSRNEHEKQKTRGDFCRYHSFTPYGYAFCLHRRGRKHRGFAKAEEQGGKRPFDDE
jgi:hypothetical protein